HRPSRAGTHKPAHAGAVVTVLTPTRPALCRDDALDGAESLGVGQSQINTRMAGESNLTTASVQLVQSLNAQLLPEVERCQTEVPEKRIAGVIGAAVRQVRGQLAARQELQRF